MNGQSVRRIRSIVLLASALTLFGWAPAQAQEPVVAENLGVITDHIARGGALAVPDVGCSDVCQSLFDGEGLDLPDGHLADQLRRDINAIRRHGRVLPRFGAAPGAYVTLGAATFYVGWKIGTGINAKFLRLGFPPEGATAGGRSQTFIPTATYSESWTDAIGGSHPESALVWHTCGSGGCFAASPTWPGAEQDFPRVPNQPGVHTASGTLITYWPGQPADVAWMDWSSVPDNLETYSGQPYDSSTPGWSGQPTSRSQLESKVLEALGSGGYPLADAWWAWQFDPQTYEDPREEEQQLDCRPLDSALGGDPAPERGIGDFLEDPDQWRARYGDVPEHAYPSGTAIGPKGLPATGGRAFMRAGFTEAVSNSLIDERGWGYRKIKAKHGWGPTALELTGKALATTGTPTGENNVTFVLNDGADLYSSRSGTRMCEWVVVVQRVPHDKPWNPELSENMPVDNLITAYGRGN